MSTDDPLPPLVLPVVLEVQPVPPPTPRLPPPGFWWSVVWAFAFFVLINGVTLVVAAGFFGVAIALAPDRQDLLDEIQSGNLLGSPRVVEMLSWAMAPGLLLAELASVCFALLIIRLLVGRDWKRQLALRRPSATHVVLALLGLPGLMVLSGGVLELAQRVLPGSGNQEMMLQMFQRWPLWCGVLVIGLGPGVGEELWCRGFLGRGLVARYGPVGGVLLTSLFFGLMHFEPPLIAATTVMGLAFHFVYLTTRSLWVPMLLHFLNNSLAVAATHVPALDVEQKAVPLIYYPAAGFLLLAVGWALYVSRARWIAGPDGGAVWQPGYSGVESPPPESGMRVVHPWPGWPAIILVLLAVLGLVALVVYT